MFFYEAGIAFVLVSLTLWLQATGIAGLISWVRRSVKGDIHALGLLHSAIFVVRFTTAVIVLHGFQILLWAGCYRWFCFPSWDSALYFSASSYSTVGYGDITLPPNWRMLGPLESMVGVLMCGLSVSILYAISIRLVGPERRSA